MLAGLLTLNLPLSRYNSVVYHRVSRLFADADLTHFRGAVPPVPRPGRFSTTELMVLRIKSSQCQSYLASIFCELGPGLTNDH